MEAEPDGVAALFPPRVGAAELGASAAKRLVTRQAGPLEIVSALLDVELPLLVVRTFDRRATKAHAGATT